MALATLCGVQWAGMASGAEPTYSNICRRTNLPLSGGRRQDPLCWHLELTHQGTLIGTLRVSPPGVAYNECSIGRVAIRHDYRGLGLGRDLMDMALAFCDARWPTVRLSAQAYLQPFYESLDFAVTSEPYLEDDIPHIEMLRSR